MCINYCSDLKDEFLDKKTGHDKSSLYVFYYEMFILRR